MESFLDAEAPLAEYLEGEGTGDSGLDSPSDNDAAPPLTTSYAPAGVPTISSRWRHKFEEQVQVMIPRYDRFDQLQSKFLRFIRGVPGDAENTKFLEQFRYLLVASELLDEKLDRRALQSTSALESDNAVTPSGNSSFSLAGSAASTFTAFALAWMIRAGRRGAYNLLSLGKPMVLLVVLAGITVLLSIHVRRRRIYNVRLQAVHAATQLTSNTRTFEAATSAALSFIQEVEVISRGYKIGNLLPPVSRLEDKDPQRRCTKLRRILHECFASTLPAYLEACYHLRPLIDEDVFQHFSNIYDITATNLERGSLGYSEHEFDDPEALKNLPVLQQRVSTFRRVMLGELLALPADGERNDFDRWRTAIEDMDRMSLVLVKFSQKLAELVSEDENLHSPPTPKASTTPGRDKVRAQIRNLNALSQGIRGLQAKMQVIREESNKAMDECCGITDLGLHLMTQYESLGHDLQALVHAWEKGKASLAVNIDKQERRISLASSGGLRSPVPSLGGLTEVDEGGSPSDALRALNGEVPPSLSGTVSTVSGNTSDEEVFEAVAVAAPRVRSALTREERIGRAHEERERLEVLREKREESKKLVRELESVISLRPLGMGGSKRYTTGRIATL